MNTLKQQIDTAELGEINLAWCVLKRQDGLGIKKKLEMLEYLFDLPEGVLVEESVKGIFHLLLKTVWGGCIERFE